MSWWACSGLTSDQAGSIPAFSIKSALYLGRLFFYKFTALKWEEKKNLLKKHFQVTQNRYLHI
jgi:hypothetical protein